MNCFYAKSSRRLLKPAAALLLAVLSLAVFAQDAAAGACETALLHCLADAAVLAVEGGVLWGVAYAAFCLQGYAFCMEFLQE